MEFKEIIKEQREELKDIEKREKIIQRESLHQAEKFLVQPNVLALLGVRRCGKSIFSYLVFKNRSFGYVNFDDERLAGLKTEQLNDVLAAFYELYGDIDCLVFDEIQNINGWELFINRLRRTKKVIITGSNSNLLSGELANYLTGRYLDLILYPFSFREFLDFHQFQRAVAYTTKEKAAILKFLNQYFEFGGFPEVKKFGKNILSRTYNDIITKDILLRYKLKKSNELKELARYLVTNFCQEISYRKLSTVLKIKQPNTLSKWLSYLEESFLFFQVARFNFKLKEQVIAPRKIYCVDNGLVGVVAFRFSKDIGRFMENTVAVELQRKKSGDSFLEIYYWKDHQQNEVDFVIKKQMKIIQLIQVSYIRDKEEIKEREIKALLRASRELKCNNLLIITYDYEDTMKVNNKKIQLFPLWKWLLQEKI